MVPTFYAGTYSAFRPISPSDSRLLPRKGEYA